MTRVLWSKDEVEEMLAGYDHVHHEVPKDDEFNFMVQLGRTESSARGRRRSRASS